jgi:hypothetical protein
LKQQNKQRKNLILAVSIFFTFTAFIDTGFCGNAAEIQEMPILPMEAGG